MRLIFLVSLVVALCISAFGIGLYAGVKETWPVPDLKGLAWILERSATGLREADLNVLSKLGNQGLEGRLEPEAFTGGEVGREDDLLDFLVGCPVYI